MKHTRIIDYLSLVFLVLSVGWLAFGPARFAELEGAAAVAAVVSSLWLAVTRMLMVAGEEDALRGGDDEEGYRALAERLESENERLRSEVTKLRTQHSISEHYIETLMDHVPANIYFKDLSSQFIRVNRSQAEWMGRGDPADMIGKTDHDFFEKVHADRALADEKKIIETGQGLIGYVEHEILPNGEEAYVLSTKMPFRNRAGTIIGTFGISTKVTDLVMAQQALERERNMLRALIDSFPDHIFVKAADGGFMLVNQSFSKFVGCTDPQEMLGQDDRDFFQEDFAVEMQEEDRRILETGEALLNEERIRTTREGEVQTVVTTKVPLIDEGGEPYAIVGMVRNVTEQRKAREALLRTERQIQDIVDNCPAVVYLKTLAGNYLLVNREYERLFNLDRDAVLGKSDYEIFDHKTAEAFCDNDSLVVEEEEAIRVEELVPQPDGAHTYLSMKFPLRDLAGEIYAVGGFSTDITDRKKHEEALRKLNDDLIKTNENLRNTQEQLIQAEKMESVGRLAAGVAHEVKNPLAMIGMGLEIVARRAKDDAKLYDAVERMRRGVERAKDIVKGLVDFSSAHQLQLVERNLNEVVKEALALANYQMKKGNVEVVSEFHGDLPLAELDATKVEQVLLNLCVNALHAMEEQGGGVLIARTRTGILKGVPRDEGARTKGHLREGDRYVAVDILDEGPGVDESKIAKIFDPFFTTKATGVGTGLGLSVARKILDLHHGMLEIVNRPEGGVRATMTFKACVDG